ncbi:hypothetical protein N1031_07080 [Herbiconiux moechotypicola]|uniref:Uncharacterized protein n=1 Tax=Herbiconiux moechotypicola TaxID=637393 RepID=A0ABN3DG84_9MICO|nr:hypothetical protein [Herbiconiux moechotypicola]MCS5729520.1 hypothetical protein [Herbiconiux moechotypicola]
MTQTAGQSTREVADALIALGTELLKAEAVQWSPAPVPQPRDDTTERASGGHSDPVPRIVTDERRLAVRAAVTGAYRAMDSAVDDLDRARVDLELAVATWNGD